MDLSKIPTMPQRQDAVTEQLSDLVLVANRLGLYDAADAVNQLMPRLPEVKYGCHVDGESDDDVMDDCVMDKGNFIGDCIEAKEGMRREQCKYWKIIK